jgi:hypothetical protein
MSVLDPISDQAPVQIGLKVPLCIGISKEPVMRRALQSYDSCNAALVGLLPSKRALLAYFEPAAIEAAVAVCFWGRSGSFLLQSYLDSHEEVVSLPEIAGQSIYAFCDEFPTLSVWDRLVAYPFYAEALEGESAALLSGKYSVSAEHYFAAIHSLYEAYGSKDDPASTSCKRFFQYLHVAFAVASGRRCNSPTPLLVCSQHWTDDSLAQRFIADFPNGKFIHTVRDPISALDSWFDRQIAMQRLGIAIDGKVSRQRWGFLSSRYMDPSGQTVRSLLRWDRAHAGMAERTRAVRFEDMHLDPENTMRRLAAWLGIGYRDSMIESTFNGVPFVWDSGGKSWVGAYPNNALRRSKNLFASDRALYFVLLRENFLRWNYPYRKIPGQQYLGILYVAFLALLPTKFEVLNLRLIWREQIVPAIRKGNPTDLLIAPMFMLARRLALALFLLRQAIMRARNKRLLLRLI